MNKTNASCIIHEIINTHTHDKFSYCKKTNPKFINQQTIYTYLDTSEHASTHSQHSEISNNNENHAEQTEHTDIKA